MSNNTTTKTTVATPWTKHYGNVPATIDYPDLSMYNMIHKAYTIHPSNIALSFMGNKLTYSKLIGKIDQVAKSLLSIGISKGSIVTVCMPNVPQTVYMLYALNKIGAIASMVHPLSAEGEIVYYMKETNSDTVLTLDIFYQKFLSIQQEYTIKTVLLASIGDALNPLVGTLYKLTKKKAPKKCQLLSNVINWNKFLKLGTDTDMTNANSNGKEVAVILFSGGTTGLNKAIQLTNLNFNALAMQTKEMSNDPVTGRTMLAAMPMFHGFGLGVCVHTPLCYGATTLLVPQVSVKSYSNILKKQKPNFIAGVPTLYEAITRNTSLDKVDMSYLKGVFSGGDSLSIELKKKFDMFLEQHNSPVRVREGYGLTECVTASCLTPYNMEKEGSIGIPYPDTLYKIVGIGTTQELSYGQEGEICIAGPTVMVGYMNRPEENNDTLKIHSDGHTWLHTGDLGYMDEDGFIFFKQRIKRLIVTSGYNVYPSQIENILDAHPAVQMSCAIGVKDPYKMHKIKAFVVLRDGYVGDDIIKSELFALLKKQIAKYALPYDIEFRDSLPKTLVGKIAYLELEKEENEKN